MKQSGSGEDGGTLIRGADGALYFVPDEKLEAFRVPDRTAHAARDQLGDKGQTQILGTLSGDVVQNKLGLRADDNTTVSVVNIAAIRRLSS